MGHPPLLPLILFVLTYAGARPRARPGAGARPHGVRPAGGRGLPRHRLDLASSRPRQAVDAPTLAVLFGMMLLSAQYRQSGLYSAIGGRLARVADPRRLLLGTILVTALLSAVLTNDVICFALTPLLAGALLASRRASPPLSAGPRLRRQPRQRPDPDRQPAEHPDRADASISPSSPSCWPAPCRSSSRSAVLYLIVAPRLREPEPAGRQRRQPPSPRRGETSRSTAGRRPRRSC